jgi:hypothetical protein
MILPTVRASFGRRHALHLVNLMARSDEELRQSAMERLETQGMDSLLDDPRVLNALLTEQDVKAPPSLVFYVLVRQSLLQRGIDSRETADYVASVVLAFARSGRAHRVSERATEEYRYLIDMVSRLGESTKSQEAFLLKAHLGNFSLWLSGLFPDFIEARVRRRGAPPIRYYEAMGATGYTMASSSPEAGTLGLEAIFKDVSRHFSAVRVALNQVSDRYLHPNGGNPVDRLLREMTATGL